MSISDDGAYFETSWLIRSYMQTILPADFLFISPGFLPALDRSFICSEFEGPLIELVYAHVLE